MKLYIVLWEDEEANDVFEEIFGTFEAAKEYVAKNDFDGDVTIVCYQYDEEDKSFVWDSVYNQQFMWVQTQHNKEFEDNEVDEEE